ncbi:MAG: glutamate--tRNA ligase [Dehalococcoidales bacterium]|nr:glutamate--tRNA ligase [Dehalococcoidales bacterium]
MTAPVRTRFAPSPTGMPQVGNMRTAIFDWLFARHCGGKFILRIEDTDRERIVPGAVETIMEGLRWLGLDWDEGPYFQSERLHLYKEAAERLVREGYAYYCYCSPERLEKMRQEQIARKQPPGYDRTCRNLTARERADYEAAGIKPVIRFRVPDGGKTTFTDTIYGEVTFENNTIDDFVMLKSDGYPTYHLASVVDDHAMKITHVIRGEEWLSSTPRHILLYQALGYEPPQYVHTPLILGPDRSKLSKRHGAKSILEYREEGYLPEAMLNFLVLIGWSLDDKTEIISRDDLIKYFTLERISKTSAVFNIEKLNWMNGVYIRSLNVEDFTMRALPFLEKGLPPEAKRPLDIAYVRRVMPLVQERVKKLTEVPALTKFFFVETLDYPAELLIAKNMTRQNTLHALEVSLKRLSELASFDETVLENLLRPLAEELGLKTGQLFSVLRTAVTGETATPPLFQTMAVLGKDRCLRRISLALEKLRN